MVSGLLSFRGKKAAPPATILDVLTRDLLRKIMVFVGPGHYRYVAGSCRSFRDAYTRQHPNSFYTSVESIVGSVQTAQFFVQDLRCCAKGCRDVDHCYFVALWAARLGQLDVLQWVDRKAGRHAWWTDKQRQLIRERTARGGHVDCFYSFKINDANKDESVNGIQLQRYLCMAAMNGHVPFLRHFYAKKGVRFTAHFMWNQAARAGHIDVLKFALEEAGCHCSHLNFDEAVSGGHMDCVIYLHTQGIKMIPPEALATAAQYGHLECLKYVFNHFEGDWESYHLTSALEKARSVDCLVFLLEKNEWQDSDIKEALVESARRNRRDQLDSHEWGNSTLERALEAAAYEGSFDCLLYLLELEDQSWSSSAIRKAAEWAANENQVKCLGRLLMVDSVEWDDQMETLFRLYMSGKRERESSWIYGLVINPPFQKTKCSSTS